MKMALLASPGQSIWRLNRSNFLHTRQLYVL
jgi:hypothetical protein